MEHHYPSSHELLPEPSHVVRISPREMKKPIRVTVTTVRQFQDRQGQKRITPPKEMP